MVKSKKSKLVNSSDGSSSNGIDRISDLPDPLISQILSLLPTKDAVATSVLSSRWKFLWTSITNLNFDFNCNIHFSRWTIEVKNRIELKNRIEMRRRKFNCFMERVLLLLNPSSVNKFSLNLCCPDCVNLSYLYSWISAGFGRNVGEFTLYLDEAMELPVSQICGYFAVLKLCGEIYLDIPAAVSLCFPSLKSLELRFVTCEIPSNSSISFPNLKIMLLECVKFKNEGSVNKLLTSSPLLDDLFIQDATYNYDDDYDMEEFIIHIPSLTRLSLNMSVLEYEDMCKLKISAPALQYLYLNGRLTCVENSSFLFPSRSQDILPRRLFRG